MKKWLFIGLVALVSVTIGLIKSNRKLQRNVSVNPVILQS